MVIVYWLSINENKKSDNCLIYYKVYSLFFENVGYVNSNNHKVIAICKYVTPLKKFINGKNDLDLHSKLQSLENKPKDTKIIDFIIRQLEKLKKSK